MDDNVLETLVNELQAALDLESAAKLAYAKQQLEYDAVVAERVLQFVQGGNAESRKHETAILLRDNPDITKARALLIVAEVEMNRATNARKAKETFISLWKAWLYSASSIQQ